MIRNWRGMTLTLHNGRILIDRGNTKEMSQAIRTFGVAGHEINWFECPNANLIMATTVAGAMLAFRVSEGGMSAFVLKENAWEGTVWMDELRDGEEDKS